MPKVVVGIDDSPESQAALAWAVDYAQHEGALLHVVTVVPPLELTALWSDRPEDNRTAVHVEAARAEADRLVRRVQLEREAPLAEPPDVVARIGHPVSVLVDCAADADLLVVGSRRPGVIGRAVGSVSDAVAHHAHCPVAIIRMPS